MTDPSKAYHMKRALLDFISAGNRLTEAWDENSVVIYPEYLPAFEDFLFEFANLMTEPEDQHELGYIARKAWEGQ